MIETVRNAWKVPELRKKIMFTIFALLIFRLGSAVPVPYIDSTTLEETEYMTYVQGLKDLGGALEYGANLTEDLIDAWDTLMGAYDTAVEGGKQVWFAVVHPQLADATYFVGTPAPLGLNEASVGSMLETTLYITPNSAPVMAAKPTEGP